MTQADRDRLVTLKKAKKKLITQREAAEELRLSVRQVKRLLQALKKQGDKAAIHGLRGRPSNNGMAAEIRQQALAILSWDVYRGFGPTLASEYLAKKHAIAASRETVRKWMRSAGLWRAQKQRVEEAHLFRPRRSRCGELVQWDTSHHDWLEGHGEPVSLISMIDDATSRLFARFVRHDSSEENRRLLGSYLERYGRPLAFYTDKAGMFQVAVKTKRQEEREGRDRPEMPPTQIARALRELDITWIAAHSPQAKGRVERSFQTAQDRLVKELRVAGARTLEQANRYLEQEFLPWWNTTLVVGAAHADDAHRKLDQRHELASILSHVENRQVKNDYTVQFAAQRYQIHRESVCSGLRGAMVRVEHRLDGNIAMRFGERYLRVSRVAAAIPSMPVARAPSAPRPATKAPKKSNWMKGFSVRGGRTLQEAIQIANATS